jgi:hypothetical protein
MQSTLVDERTESEQPEFAALSRAAYAWVERYDALDRNVFGVPPTHEQLAAELREAALMWAAAKGWKAPER